MALMKCRARRKKGIYSSREKKYKKDVDACTGKI